MITMIQSLSDKNRKKRLQNKRAILIFISLLLLASWFFLRPLFLRVFDPLLYTYFGAKSSTLTTLERTKAFFVSKEKSLAYIKELEEENSRLHNAMAKLEYSACLGKRDNVWSVSTPEKTVATSTDATEGIISVSTSTTIDPCALASASPLNENVTLRVSPMVSPISSLYDTLRINKGESAGVQIDDIVYTRGRIAIGKVVSLTRNTALVRLYSKDGLESYGTLMQGVASFKIIGNGAGSYKAKIPKDISVKEGDVILLTENQELALGVVSLVSFEKEDVAKTVYIKGGFSVGALGPLYVTLQ